jgi:hypothetical protein
VRFVRVRGRPPPGYRPVIPGLSGRSAPSMSVPRGLPGRRSPLPPLPTHYAGRGHGPPHRGTTTQMMPPPPQEMRIPSQHIREVSWSDGEPGNGGSVDEGYDSHHHHHREEG